VDNLWPSVILEIFSHCQIPAISQSVNGRLRTSLRHAQKGFNLAAAKPSRLPIGPSFADGRWQKLIEQSI
jgi:hypothetical protein